MRLEFQSPFAWNFANDAAKGAFAHAVLDSEFEVRCYKGLVAGLAEVFKHTVSFLSHKRTVGVVVGSSWAQEPLLQDLLRENYLVKSFTVDQLSNVDEIVATLGADASCFCFPEDHPLTAEIFDATALEQALHKKRIFTIRISHHGFRTRPSLLGPYAVRLCSVDPELAVALLGSRFRTPVAIANAQAWSPQLVEAQITKCFANAKEDQAAVLEFESSLGGNWRPYLNAQASRVWDRSLILNSEISGEKALHDLNLVHGADTLELCRWQGIMKNLEWWTKIPTPNQIRGSVFLDVSILSQPAVRSYFGG